MNISEEFSEYSGAFFVWWDLLLWFFVCVWFDDWFFLFVCYSGIH